MGYSGNVWVGFCCVYPSRSLFDVDTTPWVECPRIEQAEWALQELRRVSASALSAGLMADRLARNIAALTPANKNR